MFEFLVAIAVFVAFIVQTTIGFGAGLVGIPLMMFMMGPKEAVIIILVFQFLAGGILLKNKDSLEWPVLWRLFPLVCGATVLGAVSLVYIPANFVRIVLAGVLFYHLYNSYLVKSKKTINVGAEESKDDRWRKYLAGFSGGWLHGITGTGGPLFVLYSQYAHTDFQKIRCNILALLFLANIGRVCIAGVSGLFTREILEISLWALPLFVVALFLGDHISKKLDIKKMKYAVDAFLFFSACGLLIKAFG